MAHLSGLLVMVAFGILMKFSDSSNFAVMQHLQLSPLWANLVFVLALLGFGMKSGIIPLHAWLPRAHPVAPSHISALMSGVMLKVAIYGFIRFCFVFLGDIHWQWGIIVLFFGAISAVLGVLYALMQHDLKRLLAYHSVENIGIIFIGLGLAMIFCSSGHPMLGAIGFVAALYHCLNHALFKSLLFLGAGTVLQQTQEHDLEKMGGLIHKMPQISLYFLIGCISISALPPFNGFVSEWLIFQNALQAPLLQEGLLKIILPIAAAILALTSALAAACFAKVYGVAFLGKARSQKSENACEGSLGMRISTCLLASLCLFFGIFPIQAINIFNIIPQQILGTGIWLSKNSSWLWLAPISKSQGSYSALVVFVALLVLGAMLFLLKKFREKAPVAVKAWDCGFGGLTARMQYSGTAFAMPIRRVFKSFYQVFEKKEYKFINEQSLHAKSINYFLYVEDWFWKVFYEPCLKLIDFASKGVAKIQSGNLRLYLTYVFVTLIVLLWIIS
jgi:NADH:ubiquinone oxidoreductase subunit 5 (subunit L)/multisubunit Na+/H+ antiporter MnhA subunit